MNTRTDEAHERRPERRNKSRRRLRVTLILAAVAAAVLLLARAIPEFADDYTVGVGTPVRTLLARIAKIVPVSLAETLVVALVLAAAVLLVFAVYRCVRKVSPMPLVRYFVRLAGLAVRLAAVFVLLFGVSYRRIGLDERLNIADVTVTEPEIEQAAEYLLSLAGASLPTDREESGASRMPYTLSDAVRILADTAAREFPEECPGAFAVKPVFLSRPWTYTHISGLYMPFTGECNINVNYPDFVIVYSAAHEMAHHMGVMGEDEANLAAMILCLQSRDPYLIWAGAANVLEDLLADMDDAAARRMLAVCPEPLKWEYAAYSEFFEPYRMSKAATVADTVNDTYLKAQGESHGTKSYAEVKNLAVAWLRKYAMEADQ